MAGDLMDSEAVKLVLDEQSRLAEKRAVWEPTWRDIDRYIDPFGNGGFVRTNGSPVRDMEDLYDVTAIDGLDRYTAAIAGITVPRQQRWHGVEFADAELMKVMSVRRWCANAADQLFAARYDPRAGFESQIHEDIRQEGKYGTSPLWVGERPGYGLFYKTLHLSEIFVDEDYAGRIDRVYRLYCCSIRNAAREFDEKNLSDKSRKALEDPKKAAEEIEILHVVRPNATFEPGFLGAKGKPVESVYIEVAEKHVIRRSGYYSFPIPVSRHLTGPRDVYGRSPAMKVLATTKGLQVMARTLLDAANRAVDPPLLFFDDGDITKVVTKPGGLTPGGVDEQGRQMVHPLVTGSQLPVGMEMQQQEREIVQRAFLEEFFRLLSDPSDRMTATQVMETLQKEGVLVGPFAGRRETEKLAPMISRELEILMRNGTIPPLPPEAKEAGATPQIRMTNPLSRMARAEQVTGFTRLTEIGLQLAGAGRQDALDRINFDAGMVMAADVLGVPPSLIYSDDELAAIRQERSNQQEAANAIQAAPALTQAALNAAQANELEQKAA